MLYDFANIGIFVLFSALFVFGTLLVGMLFRPRNPTPEKTTIYECGEPPFGSSWVRYNSRIYNSALVFLIFAVEMAFLFPVIVVVRRFKLISTSLAQIALAEIIFFALVLALALIYAWRKGALDWIRTSLSPSDTR